ncbi:MAG: hypothetical protein WCN95_11065 [bacterium]
MARMLREEGQDDPIVQFGARILWVDGESYDNTASKFWSGLIDEVIEDYPGCDTIVLAATGSTQLERDILFPVNELQREIDKDEFIDLEDAIRQAVEEVDMFGHPAAVKVTLFEGKETVLTRDLSREYIDSNVFSYLLAWLLQWSNVPASKWQDELLSGRIYADDPARNVTYGITLAFCNKHLSEGLYNRSVTVRFLRQKLD